MSNLIIFPSDLVYHGQVGNRQ